jgi:hypothetical protein
MPSPSGPCIAAGPATTRSRYTYAPDGTNVLILGNESPEAWLAPVDRTDPRQLDVGWGILDDPPEWQRLAP